MPLLPATWEVEVEDHKFKANLGNRVRLLLRTCLLLTSIVLGPYL